MYIPDSWIRRLNNINKPFQPKSLKFARELEDSCIRLGDSRIRKESCICIPASVNLSLQFGLWADASSGEDSLLYTSIET